MFKSPFRIFGLSFLVILLGYGVYQYLRPLPPATVISRIASVPKTQAVSLPWPSAGQAAVGASGYGVLETHNSTQPTLIASITKVITAVAVLKQKPIAPGTQGATITLDGTDVGFFNKYYLNDGSVAQVTAGEQITQVQALQAMLIPSANNIADSLARWAFGSVDAYLTYANQMVKDMGLTNTKVGDTNGFSDTTLSTADDLVKLGIVALTYPPIAQVVSQSSAQVPVAGTVKNVNFLLGQDGVVGIKTGNTDKAGGCYLFAAQREVAGHKITLVGAILGQPSLVSALQAAPNLIRTSDSGFEQITAVHKGQVFGSFKTAWNSSAQYKAAKDLSLLVWKGKEIEINTAPNSLTPPAKSGTNVGAVTVQSSQQSVNSTLVLSQDLPKPSLWWRIVSH
jgi:D-alanyl-D-alanine carboxypeptidase (penicillin-binding protein 5/6)